MRSLLGKTIIFLFTTTAVVVIIFSLVINFQISDHFSQYLNMHQGMHGMGYGMRNGMFGYGMGREMMMGQPEQEFLASLRHSLFITTGLMLLIGAAVSYYFARSIALPVIGLNKAVKSVAEGNLDINVKCVTNDEVGQLAAAFNDMLIKLKTNNILRQRFLAGVAHEIRTPLTILRANLEGMIDGVIPQNEAQLTSLNEEVNRLTVMVEDLRDLSLLEAGQLRLELIETDINKVITNIVTKLKPLAVTKGISLRMKLKDIPMLIADEYRLNQVIYNLVINALNYTSAGGYVEITASNDTENIRIDVADSGIGIAAEHLAHIFDHFYRIDSSRAKKSGGTGLGLAVVKQLVAAHEGRVSVVSRMGQGSTFTVQLPIRQQKHTI